MNYEMGGRTTQKAKMWRNKIEKFQCLDVYQIALSHFYLVEVCTTFLYFPNSFLLSLISNPFWIGRPVDTPF
jgi:hypothetical protein